MQLTMLQRRIHHFCRSVLVHQHTSSRVTNGTNTACIIWPSLSHQQHRTLITCAIRQTWSCNYPKLVYTNRICNLNHCSRFFGITRHSCLPESSESDQASENSGGNKKQQGPDASKMSFLEARKMGLIKSRRHMSPFQRVAGLMEEQKLPTKEISDEFGEVSTEMEDHAHFSEPQSVEKNKDSLTDTADDKQKVEFFEQSNNPSSQVQQLCKKKPSIPLSHGEYVIVLADISKKNNVRSLIKLNEVATFECKLGKIQHSDVIGSPAGTQFRTHLGMPVVIRRPSLEEYVLLMRRGPTILYPKDASTMLMMADISPGDVVVEAGTGSGAMTLFISKAVGATGHVFTFEMRQDHQKRGIKNWRRWKASWDISHPDNKWPDNVSFHNTGLQHCDNIIEDDTIDGVLLDIGSAGHVMPILCRKLKAGKPIIVYVPQITQTMDVLEAIQAHQLPVLPETVLEVSHKSWLVKEANITSINDVDVNRKDSDEANAAGCLDDSSNVAKYICRPQHVQLPHTGFLVQLRKIVSSPAHKN